MACRLRVTSSNSLPLLRDNAIPPCYRTIAPFWSDVYY